MQGELKPAEKIRRGIPGIIYLAAKAITIVQEARLGEARASWKIAGKCYETMEGSKNKDGNCTTSLGVCEGQQAEKRLWVILCVS